MELSNWRQKERDVSAMLKRLRGAPSALSHFTVDSRNSNLLGKSEKKFESARVPVIGI